jgi:hypothetical protein
MTQVVDELIGHGGVHHAHLALQPARITSTVAVTRLPDGQTRQEQARLSGVPPEWFVASATTTAAVA